MVWLSEVSIEEGGDEAQKKKCAKHPARKHASLIAPKSDRYNLRRETGAFKRTVNSTEICVGVSSLTQMLPKCLSST
jgi:hypothetical protein